MPVNFGQLRNPKRDMVWVALAGPVSNFIQAMLWALVFVGLRLSGVARTFFLKMAQAGVLVNLVMWAFNLFPLPPLDGGRVLAGILPRGRAQELLARIEPMASSSSWASCWRRRRQILAEPADGAGLRGHQPSHLSSSRAAALRVLQSMASTSYAPTRFLTGITTSGTPHLGNYVGSVRPSVRASRRDDVQSFYFLADYHALIKIDEPARIQRSTLESPRAGSPAASTPKRVTFYRQSDIPEIPELTLVPDLRDRQGAPQPRACVQGAARQESRQGRRARRRRDRRVSSCTRC